MLNEPKPPYPIPTVPMKPYRFKTQRARLTALLITPVVLILLITGVLGYIYAHHFLFGQWRERVMLQLEWAVQEIEMALSMPLEQIEMFSNSATDTPGNRLLETIVGEMESLPGVIRTHVKWHLSADDGGRGIGRQPVGGQPRIMRFQRGAFTRIGLPRIDPKTGQRTVSVTMVLMDSTDTPVGNLEIVIRFDTLVSEIVNDPWWQTAKACIAERESGKIILASGRMPDRQKLGETGDHLEGRLLAEIDRIPGGTLFGPGIPPKRIVGYQHLANFPLVLVVFADGKTVLAPIIDFGKGFIVGGALLILVIYGIIRFNVDRTAETILSLSRQAEILAAGDYAEKIEVTSRDEIGRLAASFNAMVDGLQERDTIRNTFGLYVDPDFARALLNQPEAGRLGGRRQRVAILMADIRGFTPMAAHLTPEETIEVLNRYFSAIIPLVQQHNGIIVDFVGDAILAFFEPAADSFGDALRRCVRCAFDMHAAMDRLNRQMAHGSRRALKMGIGVNSGPVVVGNIGSAERKKYGIVGAAVNTTQRIQGQSEAGEVVVSQAVFDEIEAEVTIERTFSASLKGIAAPAKLYGIRKL